VPLLDLLARYCIGGVITEMQGNRLLKSTRKGLDSTTLVDPSVVYRLPPQKAQHLKWWLVPLLDLLLGAVSVMLVVFTEMQGNGLLKSTRKGLGQAKLWWILSGSIPRRRRSRCI
jgi:hypothetical protein